MTDALARLLRDIRACRVCVAAPQGTPLPHAPRPVVRARATARILIVGQAPGTRVHQSGLPFDDPSGDRLRDWMGVTREEFYDEDQIAFAPMGFCFPGLDAKGADLPPRKECAPLWRDRLMAALPAIDLMLLLGRPAQRWHLPDGGRGGLAEVIRLSWSAAAVPGAVTRLALPHPSWRNSGWLKAHPWFAEEMLPRLKAEIRSRLRPGRSTPR